MHPWPAWQSAPDSLWHSWSPLQSWNITKEKPWWLGWDYPKTTTGSSGHWEVVHGVKDSGTEGMCKLCTVPRGPVRVNLLQSRKYAQVIMNKVYMIQWNFTLHSFLQKLINSKQRLQLVSRKEKSLKPCIWISCKEKLEVAPWNETCGKCLCIILHMFMCAQGGIWQTKVFGSVFQINIFVMLKSCTNVCIMMLT